MALDGGVEFSLLTNMPYFLDLTRSLQQEYFKKNMKSAYERIVIASQQERSSIWFVNKELMFEIRSPW